MGRGNKKQLFHVVSFKNTQHPLPTNIGGTNTCLCLRLISVFLFRAVKKSLLVFPSPAGMSLIKLSLGKTMNFFYSACVMQLSSIVGNPHEDSISFSSA
jgi:hypothetical protein